MFYEKIWTWTFLLAKKSQKYSFFFSFLFPPLLLTHWHHLFWVPSFLGNVLNSRLEKNLNLKYTFVDNLQTILNTWKVDNKYCIFTWIIYFYNLVNMAERVKYVCNNSGVKGITILLTSFCRQRSTYCQKFM